MNEDVKCLIEKLHQFMSKLSALAFGLVKVTQEHFFITTFKVWWKDVEKFQAEYRLHGLNLQLPLEDLFYQSNTRPVAVILAHESICTNIHRLSTMASKILLAEYEKVEKEEAAGVIATTENSEPFNLDNVHISAKLYMLDAYYEKLCEDKPSMKYILMIQYDTENWVNQATASQVNRLVFISGQLGVRSWGITVPVISEDDFNTVLDATLVAINDNSSFIQDLLKKAESIHVVDDMIQVIH